MFLPTVQIGITLLAILSGAFGESTFSKIILPVLKRIPALARYSETIATLCAVLLITYLTLIIGELVPKSLALNNPEPIESVVAIPMRTLATITSPVVKFLGYSTDVECTLFSLWWLPAGFVGVWWGCVGVFFG